MTLELEVKRQPLEPVPLEYSLSGPEGAPVVVFAHGLGSNLYQFSEQAGHFQADYRVLLFSLRGHGDSGRPSKESKETYTPRSLASDVLRLLDSLGINGVYWVGHCLGGLVGYEFFKKAKNRLLSLATYGTATVFRYDPFTTSTLIWCRDMVTKFCGYSALCRMAGRGSSRNRDVQAKVATMMLAASSQAVRFTQINMGRYNYLETLDAIKVPVLILRAEHDREVNLNLRSAEKVLRGNPRGRIVELPAAGHFANLDQPEKFNHTIGTWLQKVTPPKP